ncbi:segregation and condensation protein B [Gemella bergeri ATCC 700627]|uniref:Segregation and condensation protein B n=1 Tax=Gemella bergeri ATCC 700627 TaxID=1321820 RepID=U2S1K6_9BACL|nr:SMC-Scp complex subunit ScpB [Gemella bergeri]ERK59623.1 segregation and condensation protein B [Gemella bergeri ATCC 700627]
MLLDETRKTIEALLFMKGEDGVSIEFFSAFMEIDSAEAQNMLNVFCEEYNKTNNSLTIKRYGSLYKMLIKDEIYNMIKKAIVSKNLVKLSKSSLETLAIIAYNQPITKTQIDKIRGVNSDTIIYSLVNKELIISNKTLDTIGKPKLYETTELFLDVFGLENLEELPKSEIINEDELTKFLKD